MRPWREPRLLLGVLLVLGATVLGARLAAGGDDMVEYWAVRTGVTAGDTVTRESLEPRSVRLTGATAGTYLRTDDELPAALDDLVWSHALPEGSLVGKASLVARSTQARGELPLNVAAGSAPDDLARGDRVDVWVGPGPGEEAGGDAVKVLTAVTVLDAGADAAAIGGAPARTVLVGVDESRIGTEVVGTVGARHVTLVRVS